MISTPSKLSQIIYDESSSFLYHPPYSREQLNAIRKQLALLPQAFQIFQEQIFGSVREWLGKISALVYRQAKEKIVLESQLQKSKQVQQKMRSEVIQLKQMINEAMIGYSKELECKNSEISKLKCLLENNKNQEQQIKMQEEQKNQANLEIIQEQSEQATFSSARTLIEFKEEEQNQYFKGEQSIYQESSRSKEIIVSPKNIQESQIVIQQPKSQLDSSKNEHKRTKSFIDNFRKTIEQSFMEKQFDSSQSSATYEACPSSKTYTSGETQKPNNSQNTKPYKLGSPSQPLRQITNYSAPLQNKVYINSNVCMLKQGESGFSRPKISFSIEQFKEASNVSSYSQQTRIDETSQIFSMKNFETPKNQSFLKKKDNQRMFTEPSPENTRYKQNFFSNKPPQTTHQQKSSDRTSSYEQGKSMKNGTSKQKIKVTSRMMEEMKHSKRNPNSSSVKAVVYLGGKSIFRKFLIQLKQSFKKYVICAGLPQQEVKYEGQKRNKMRWGRGRLFYRNGMVYEGEFRQNMRHGRGSLFINGLSIYEGQWVTGSLQGEGYLKSMKYMSKDCPSVFNESSFCGNLMDNRLHGIGTIFLNSKQKIVTKFNGGVPVGELTYYNLHEIEFGVWPSQ